MKRLFWLALLFPVLTIAQVQKCTIDGKTVYSDSLCGQRGQAVNTDANSLDTSGLRDLADKQAEQAKAKELAAAAKSTKSRSDPCAGIMPFGKAPNESQRAEYNRCKKSNR